MAVRVVIGEMSQSFPANLRHVVQNILRSGAEPLVGDCEGVSGFDECVKLLFAGDHLAVCLGEQSDAKGLPGLQEEGLLESRGALRRETVR